MPEGDTLYRTAAVLGRALGGGQVRRARGRPGGVQLERVEGSRIVAVEAKAKHLLIGFDTGLTLHTHLGMKGSWHRYRPGEPWRRDPARAVAVIETERMLAACFDAPTVELIETRALPQHPVLGRLGPDLLAEPPDLAEAVARLLAPERASLPIAEVLLDQGAVGGIGNVYRSEVLFSEGVDPFIPVAVLSTADLDRLLRTAARLLRANLEGGERVTVPDGTGALPGPGTARPRSGARWVYRRAGMPCRRCGTPIRSASLGASPRRLYWCPTCQRAASVPGTEPRHGSDSVGRTGVAPPSVRSAP